MPYDITYMWNLKYKADEPIYETEMDPQRENRPVLAKGKGKQGRMNWEFGVRS